MGPHYLVRTLKPEEHRAQFLLEVDPAGDGPIDLVLPSWVPGSYSIRPTARAVGGLKASARPSGTPLSVERVDKGRWRILPAGAPSVRVEYEVYGHDTGTGSFDVTAEHLFLNAAVCLPYVDGRKDVPHEVSLLLPAGWKIFTELEEVELQPPTFRAASYDELVDTPIDCGTPEVLVTTPRGVPHRIALCGKGGNYEAHRLETDLSKLVEATARLFGTLPMSRYTFFVHLTEQRGGGLEHKTSTSLVVPRWMFRPESEYQNFLVLASHEYFHLFNVKRIRPKVLGPFDYTKENYTSLLWAMEGTTDYYAPLLVRRAGLLTPPKYLERLASRVRLYLDVPGRRASSLEEASWTTWISFYQPFEDSLNETVSYYLKGGLVSWCLDLALRHGTENRSSLDDVYRTLWNEFGAKEVGLGEEEFFPVVQRVSGLDLDDFYRRYIRGTEEIDLAAFARYAGLKLAPKERSPDAEDDPEPGYLGIDTESANGMIRVRAVRDGTPARRAGLSPGDEIVAFDGVRVTFDQLGATLKRFPAGSEIDLALFRRGYLTHVKITTGTGLAEKYELVPVEEPTPLERKIYESWLEAPWTPPKAKPPSETPKA
ncbi:MAG TPA: PDZ domain-containing protein [Thermoplasmata archaeon]|nr:PDZ domain-containing protein [Thermoplasmata archaeon]